MSKNTQTLDERVTCSLALPLELYKYNNTGLEKVWFAVRKVENTH